jgi:hypothetical protein
LRFANQGYEEQSAFIRGIRVKGFVVLVFQQF